MWTALPASKTGAAKVRHPSRNVPRLRALWWQTPDRRTGATDLLPGRVSDLGARLLSTGEGIVMAPTGILHKITVEQAEARRSEILREQGTTAEDLRSRAGRYELDAAGVAALAELEDLDYLLGETVE